eukprot:COSAG01_NODE_568_length_15370_cov_26.058018_7_plen_96_part_00
MKTNTLFIPTPLRAYTEQQASITFEQIATVKDLLSALLARYTALKPHLYNEENQLRKFINIYVNDEDIRYLDHLNTPLPDKAEVSIVPSIAGGHV